MIGIIGAMESELECISRALNKKKEEVVGPFIYETGLLFGKEVVISKCLEGKVNAAICTQMMLQRHQVEYVLNVGVAGGVSDSIGLCDIAISSATVEFDQDTTALGYPLGYTFGLEKVVLDCDSTLQQQLYEVSNSLVATKLGVIASSDTFVVKEETKSMLRETFDAIAVDMEAASIHHVCQLNGVRFCSIRAISDSGSKLEFREFVTMAIENLNKVLFAYIKMENRS